MNVVTIGAGHLPFTNRVMIGLAHLPANIGMTGVTKGRFILGSEERLFTLLLHDTVAADAADSGGLVSAALPVDLLAAFVALQTDVGLLRRTRSEFPTGILQVLTARDVTRPAIARLQVAFGAVGERTIMRGAGVGFHLCLVTLDTRRGHRFGCQGIAPGRQHETTRH